MKMIMSEEASSAERSATGVHSFQESRRQSNRAPQVAKTNGHGARPITARAFVLGAVAMVLPLALASCGKKSPSSIDAEISQTTVYRGVFVSRESPLLVPRDPSGTISLSITEAWDARRRAGGVAYESAATVDSAVVQLATNDGRSTLPARFDRSTGSLTVSGAPWLNSTMTNGRFEGLEVGRAFVIVPPAHQTIRAYCGSWSGTGSSGEDNGRLGLLIDGSNVTGVAINPTDDTVDRVEGSYAADGGIVMTIPSYTFTGETSQYAIFGSYESTLDGRRSGTWTVGPRSF
jgi:hypothetical protein